MRETKPTLFDQGISFLNTLTRPVGNDRSLSALMALAFAGFVAVIVLLGTLQPGYPFDLAVYLGVALQNAGASDFHHQAWSLVQQAAPSDVYDQLANGDAYRQRQSTDPAAFQSMFPMYSVKAGYIALLEILGPTFGWIKSSLWVNRITGLGLGLVCLLWMTRHGFAQAAPVVAGVLLATNYFDAIRFPSPDTLATLLTLMAVYLWLRAREMTAFAILLVAFMFRPDTILFAFALLLSAVVLSLPKWRIGVLFIILLGLSFLIREVNGHPGWWTHYYFSNVSIQPTLEGFDPAFNILAYLKGIARGVFASMTGFGWPIILIFCLTGIAALVRTGAQFAKRQTAMIMACVLAIGGKFIVFPLPDDRIYMAFILALVMITLEVWQPRFGWQPNKQVG